MYFVRLDFNTSDMSDKLLNVVFQCQYDLASKCSSYQEAKHAFNGVWVIISTEDETHIDTVKHELQQQWEKFLTNTRKNFPYEDYDEQENISQLLTIRTCSNLKRSQTALDRSEAHHPIHRISQQRSHTDHNLVDRVLLSDQTRLRFLSNRFENSSRGKQPRTHRRQHILALGLVA